jgi:hypothetical protein
MRIVIFHSSTKLQLEFSAEATGINRGSAYAKATARQVTRIPWSGIGRDAALRRPRMAINLCRQIRGRRSAPLLPGIYDPWKLSFRISSVQLVVIRMSSDCYPTTVKAFRSLATAAPDCKPPPGRLPCHYLVRQAAPCMALVTMSSLCQTQEGWSAPGLLQ